MYISATDGLGGAERSLLDTLIKLKDKESLFVILPSRGMLADKIEEIENWDSSRINEKKELLAYELTELVHGKEEADKAKESAHALFSGNGDSANMPTTTLSQDDLNDGEIGAVGLLVKCRLCASNGEAKRLVQQGGVSINDEVVDMSKRYSANDLSNGLKIRKGKKHFHKVLLG